MTLTVATLLTSVNACEEKIKYNSAGNYKLLGSQSFTVNEERQSGGNTRKEILIERKYYRRDINRRDILIEKSKT